MRSSKAKKDRRGGFEGEDATMSFTEQGADYVSTIVKTCTVATRQWPSVSTLLRHDSDTTRISSDTQITKQNNIRPCSASHAAHLRDPAAFVVHKGLFPQPAILLCACAQRQLLAPRSAPRPVHRPVALSIPCALTFIACISLHIGCECLPCLDARPSLIGGEHLRDRAEQFLARLGHLELGRINFGGEQLVELLSHAEQQPLLLHGD